MLIYRCRATIYKHQIDHDDMRGLIRKLKDTDAIWYSPDQDFTLNKALWHLFWRTRRNGHCTSSLIKNFQSRRRAFVFLSSRRHS